MRNNFINGKVGVFLASGNEIYSKFRLDTQSPIKKIAPHDILSISNPLPCIACCPIHIDRNSAASMKKYLEFYYPNEIDPTIDNPISYHKEISPEIASFLECAGKSQELADWEFKFKDSFFDGANALIVLDLRTL